MPSAHVSGGLAADGPRAVFGQRPATRAPHGARPAHRAAFPVVLVLCAPQRLRPRRREALV